MQGFAEVVEWDHIRDHLHEYPHLKISPLAMIPHKSRKYRSILDLSFRLKMFGFDLCSVNAGTLPKAPPEAMDQLRTVLPCIIEAIVNAPEEAGDILFTKLDIKDGFWRMVVPEEQRWNFCYVLPDKPGRPVRLVVSSALQMGWSKSPPFFCSVSEMARDVADDMRQEPEGIHAPHPLKEWMMPPDQWPEDELAETCERFFEMIEVYVDDFIGIAQTRDPGRLHHLSRLLLHAIHQVFPPPNVTGHAGDSVLKKKLQKGEGTWDVRKEILGWLFDGARWCIEFPPEKANKILRELKAVCRLNRVPRKCFEKLVGKLHHAAIGIPSGWGLFTSFNHTLQGHAYWIRLGQTGEVHRALQDWQVLLRAVASRSTHVCKLV